MSEAHFAVLLRPLVDLERSKIKVKDKRIAKMPKEVSSSKDQNVPQRSLDCPILRRTSLLCHALQIFLLII